MHRLGRLLVIWGVALPLAVLPWSGGLAPGADPLAGLVGRLVRVGGDWLPYAPVLSAGVVMVAVGLSLGRWRR